MALNFQQNYQIYRRYTRDLALIYQKRQDIRAFVELLLSIGAVVLFGLFAIRPTVVTIISLNNQINEKRSVNSQLDTKIQALSDAQEIYELNRENLLLLDEAIPSEPSAETFIRQVEGLAQRHSVEVSDMVATAIPLDGAASADSGTEPAPSFEYKVTLEGSYDSLNSFLAEFENLRRPLYENKVSLQLVENEAGSELALSVSGRLTYLPNEQ